MYSRTFIHSTLYTFKLFVREKKSKKNERKKNKIVRSWPIFDTKVKVCVFYGCASLCYGTGSPLYVQLAILNLPHSYIRNTTVLLDWELSWNKMWLYGTSVYKYITTPTGGTSTILLSYFRIWYFLWQCLTCEVTALILLSLEMVPLMSMNLVLFGSMFRNGRAVLIGKSRRWPC